ncbi:MAG: chemotaxis protein CheW, partial [Phototrophicales bacterium]
MSAELAITNKNGSQQVLTFRIGEKYFAVDILTVKEIHGWAQTRDVPDTPEWIVGVSDRRGTIVPIVDLRIRFGEHKVEYTKTTVVVILQAVLDVTESDDSLPFTMGIVVDAVSD